MEPHIGKRLMLAPFHLVDELGRRVETVTKLPCTIVYVNKRHRYFTVEFAFKSAVTRESFKYSFHRKPGGHSEEMLIW